MESEEVLEQEPVVEEPVPEPEPVVEPETPTEEPVVEPEPQPAPEPMQIYTRGEWADLELLTEKEMEVGKTYRIKVSGHCQFMISAEKPTTGMVTNEITYTKDGTNRLWIKTGA